MVLDTYMSRQLGPVSVSGLTALLASDRLAAVAWLWWSLGGTPVLSLGECGSLIIMAFNPLAAVGIVSVSDEKFGRRMSGTCFLFRFNHIALTAAHCVQLEATDTQLVLPGLGRVAQVTRIDRHPTADIAVLFTELGPQDTTTGVPDPAFQGCPSNWGLGESFVAYGFPEEINPDGSALTAQPRLFQGHYQRFFNYESSGGFRYVAGEMSIPAPGGLSGGPLFRAPHAIATGMVTANHDSYSIVDSIDEVDDNGRRYRQESRRIISYGVALMLSSVQPWLKEIIPEREGWVWLP